MELEAESLRLKAKSRKQKVKEHLPWPFAFSFLLFAFSFYNCSTKSESTSSPSVNSTKFQQYYIQGEQLYITHCSNCHQKNGTGLGLLFPPLNKSDFVDNNFEKVICIMEHGISGELIVNGKSYNKEMKGIPSLTDLEIAEIATYIYNTWGREQGIVEVQRVSTILSGCDSVLSHNKH
ncbi:MAG TPA: cytochrome c [Ohtaekwangia sp.]